MSMLAKITTAINTVLFNQLAQDLASQFDLDQGEVAAFVKEWSKTNVGTAARQAKPKKDPNVPTRTSGYLMFCAQERPKLNKSKPNLKNTEVMTMLGQAWSKLTDAKKTEWNAKAATQNSENGITTGKGSKKVADKKPVNKTTKKDKETEEITTDTIEEWFKAKGGKSIKELREMAIALELGDSEEIAKMSKKDLKTVFEASIAEAEDAEEEEPEDEDGDAEEKPEAEDGDAEEEEEEPEDDSFDQDTLEGWFSDKGGKTMKELKDLATQYELKFKPTITKAQLKKLFEALLD